MWANLIQWLFFQMVHATCILFRQEAHGEMERTIERSNETSEQSTYSIGIMIAIELIRTKKITLNVVDYSYTLICTVWELQLSMFLFLQPRRYDTIQWYEMSSVSNDEHKLASASRQWIKGSKQIDWINYRSTKCNQ